MDLQNLQAQLEQAEGIHSNMLSKVAQAAVGVESFYPKKVRKRLAQARLHIALDQANDSQGQLNLLREIVGRAQQQVASEPKAEEQQTADPAKVKELLDKAKAKKGGTLTDAALGKK